jgi:hypothetical protein
VERIFTGYAVDRPPTWRSFDALNRLLRGEFGVQVNELHELLASRDGNAQSDQSDSAGSRRQARAERTE